MKTTITGLICMILSLHTMGQKIPSAVFSWESLEVKKQETRESRAILEGNTTHLAYFESHATTLYPGKMPHSSHRHDVDEELILVRQGRLKITSEGISGEIGPGGLALLMPGEEHGLENIGDTNAIYYILKYRSKNPIDVQRSTDAGGTIIIDRADLEFISREKGGRWNYFNRPTAACEDFEMHATKLNAGLSSHPPHTHVQEEVILLLEGRARMHIDGKDYEVAPGDFVFLDSLVPHNITNTGTAPCVYFAFQWK